MLSHSSETERQRLARPERDGRGHAEQIRKIEMGQHPHHEREQATTAIALMTNMSFNAFSPQQRKRP